ncbi:MAG TPA: glycine--tRNA ligase [Ignavibacteria bacterium]|nr:glycine--tRNA ligase [Ignavibacteria bacterium]
MKNDSKSKQGSNASMDKIVSLAKRRGFVFQSSEIYGGLNGCWDFGPLGVELLNNIKQAWWQAMTYRDDVEGLDASILMHPKVWEASGHVENFTDPMVDCKQCKARYRVDLLFESLPKKSKKHIEDKIRATLTSEIAEVNEISINNYFSDNIDHFTPDITCPTCGNTGTFTNARKFNLMFKTFIGAIESEDSIAYLRPETAQGIFVNYGNVKESTRQKLPFGIAQIGKAFRNEINTKNFLFRVREFEQMEMQYFVKPGSDDDLYNEWKERRIQWWVDLGIKRENLNFAPHPADKLAHYAKAAVDIEFKFPFGFGEIEGIHNRSDFDLSQHSKFSGKKLDYYDEQNKERFIPYVIETSAGATRGFMAFLCNAFDEDEAPTSDGKSEVRTVLHFHPKLAPIKCAVFPLVNKDGLQEISQNITQDLQKTFKVFYDDSGAVGRRYRRQDECGTPFCVTVDYDTLKDDTVTIRERDSMQQERVHKDKIKMYILEKLNS